jgi:hypothetical protein
MVPDHDCWFGLFGRFSRLMWTTGSSVGTLSISWLFQLKDCCVGVVKELFLSGWCARGRRQLLIFSFPTVVSNYILVTACVQDWYYVFVHIRGDYFVISPVRGTVSLLTGRRWLPAFQWPDDLIVGLPAGFGKLPVLPVQHRCDGCGWLSWFCCYLIYCSAVCLQQADRLHTTFPVTA